MNKLFLALLLLLPLTGMANEDEAVNDLKGRETAKPVVCYDYVQFVRSALLKYNERSVFDSANAGLEGKTSVALFKNAETGTWTLFEYNESHTMACILAYGTDKVS